MLRYPLFKSFRRLFYLVILVCFAVFEAGRSGIVRRTFEFFVYNQEKTAVEDRVLFKADSKELNIKRYVEEVVLGPVSVDLAPLFPPETRLRSFLFRDGIVYADLNTSAALPVVGGRDLFDNMTILNRSIRRNFAEVRDVKLFIGGNEVFFNEFKALFGTKNSN
jgi:hypothetical protein